ncbi:MAG TPA: hypothetical protein PK006_02665 [Saprospiraceae bacterium]|nr:hypothetical protein [Saprospiraceae bacterium]
MDQRISDRWDKVWWGIAVGIIMPIMGYGLLLFIYDLLDRFDILEPSMESLHFRERTIALLAIFVNILPIQFFNRIRFWDAMRGIVFPTLFYVALWMYYFGFALLQSNE